jgi:mycothiol system anti-sigma-R factor
MSNAGIEPPPLMSCRAAASALYDFLDGRLSDGAVSAVQGHIDTCRTCASHYDFARQVLTLIPASLPLPSVSEELRGRIITSLQAEGYSAPV